MLLKEAKEILNNAGYILEDTDTHEDELARAERNEIDDMYYDHHNVTNYETPSSLKKLRKYNDKVWNKIKYAHLASSAEFIKENYPEIEVLPIKDSHIYGDNLPDYVLTIKIGKEKFVIENDIDFNTGEGPKIIGYVIRPLTNGTHYNEYGERSNLSVRGRRTYVKDINEEVIERLLRRVNKRS